MALVPRVAFGTVQRGACGQAPTLAVMTLLTRQGLQIQHFASRACLSPHRGAIAATGLNTRHLDSWLMSRPVCRELLEHGLGRSDLAVIDGRFQSALSIGERTGGSLELLCSWLDIPRVAVVDVTLVRQCALPDRPENVDAVLLDGVDSPRSQAEFETLFESQWGVPIIGAIESLPRVRQGLASLGPGSGVPRELCDALADSLAQSMRLDRLRAMAARRACCDAPPELFARRRMAAPVTVAVAFDEAFHCYFPDTFDLLEAWGAKVVDFSPLRDESLPPDTDVVLLGCGRTDLFAAELAKNHCMLTAIRNHVRSRGRVYADGGGLAYLCQHIEAAGGEHFPLVGVIPAVARRTSRSQSLRAVDLTLSRSSWLGEAHSRVRGYLNPNWILDHACGLSSHIGEQGHEHDLVGRYGAVGSRVQLNFLAAPERLRRLLEPVRASDAHALAGARGA